MKKKHFLSLIIFVMGIFLAAFNVQAAEKVIMPERVCRSGDYVYYQIGTDLGDSIHKYNVKTKSDKVLVKGHFLDITESGNYLYVTKNISTTPAGRTCYIYRVGKDGKGLKKLAKGSSPVVMGDWIYYFYDKSVPNPEWGPHDVRVGLYRMKKDGSSKQAVHKSGNMMSYMMSSSKIYYSYMGSNSVGWKSMSLTGKNIKKASFGSQTTNSTGSMSNPIKKITYGGYSYAVSGKNLYRTKSGVKKKIAAFTEPIRNMIELNGWLFVIGDDFHTPNVDVYILKGDGTNKKLIKRFVAAGGGY